MKFYHNPKYNVPPRAPADVCKHLMAYLVTRQQTRARNTKKGYIDLLPVQNGNIQGGQNSEYLMSKVNFPVRSVL